MEITIKRIAVIIIIIFTTLLISCITPAGITTATTPLYDKVIVENHGKVRDTDSVWALFGLWMFGRPDIDEAINDALSQKGGNALINVKVYNNKQFFFLFSRDQVIVEGEAVTLKKK